jgi:hypothetical protein
MFYYQLSNRQAADLLYELYPHLIVKQRQAALGLHLQSLIAESEGERRSKEGKLRGRMRDDDYTNELIKIWATMKSLNHFGNPDVSWVPTPEYGRWSGCAKYYYDAEAIKEPVSETSCGSRKEFRGGGSYTGGNSFDNSAYKPNRTPGNTKRLDKEVPNSRMHVSRDPDHEREYNGKHRNELEQSAGRRILKNVAAARAAGGDHDSPFGNTRNKRSVWTVATAPYSEAHFATFPPDLIKPCILAGTKPGDVVLDPFGGSGTTGQVALELGRSAILIELNPDYCRLMKDRTNVTPGLAL